MKLKIIQFLGNLVGVLTHFFKGHEPFWVYVRNTKGKFKSRHCRRCGKRWDRENGKWKYMGRYARRK